jgi:hypothetical protein
MPANKQLQCKQPAPIAGSLCWLQHQCKQQAMQAQDPMRGSGRLLAGSHPQAVPSSLLPSHPRHLRAWASSTSRDPVGR